MKISKDSLSVRDQVFELIVFDYRSTAAFSLYILYKYQVMEQQTNPVHYPAKLARRDMYCGEDKFRKAKNILKEALLIEDIKVVDPTTKRIKKWLVKVNDYYRGETHEDQDTDQS